MTEDSKDGSGAYKLDDQVGFLMRKANQRHLALFAQTIGDVTPTQFAALSKLCDLGQVSQNALGRATAMDAATIKGVVDRLRGRGYIESQPDPDDSRRVHLRPTREGRSIYARLQAHARAISEETLAPLNARDQQKFLKMLKKLG